MLWTKIGAHRDPVLRITQISSTELANAVKKLG